MSETKREIVFGTGNPAKVAQISGALKLLGIEVKSLKDFDVAFPEVVEDGQTALENATKKAKTYAEVLGRVVFSMDNGLYLDPLPDDEQPGIHVRRMDGIERATDQQLLDHYIALVERLGGRVVGRWDYALAMAWPDGKCVTASTAPPRIFVSTPSSTVLEGYPLESIQIDPESGKYIAEMTEDEQAEFWHRTIGQAVGEFVDTNL